MIKKLTLIFALALGVVANGQIISLKDVTKLKSSKVIIATQENQEVSKSFEDAVREFWSFAEIHSVMPISEALDKAKSDESLYVIKFGKKTSRSMTHSYAGNNGWGYRFVSSSKVVAISNGKKDLSVVYIPTYGDNELSKEAFVFGVSVLQDNISTMDEKQIKGMGVMKVWKERGPGLADKTLLIPEGWTHEKLTMDVIKDNYSGKCEVVSHEVWKNAILNKEEGKAYVILSPVSIGGDYVYQHYLMNCSDASIFSVVQSKVAVKLAAPSGKINLSKGNSGYIKDKNIKMYNKVLGK